MKPIFDDVKLHILHTGQQLIACKGFAGVGLTEMLTTAGVPKGSFYYYFESKEKYGTALLEHYFDTYLERLETLLGSTHAPSGSAHTRLMNYWASWLEVQSGDNVAEQCLVVKLTAEVCDLSEIMRASLREGTERIVSRLAACIEAGQAEGSIGRGREPRQAALTLYQLWLGASLLTKARRDRSALECALAETRRMLAGGEAEFAYGSTPI